MRWQRKNSLASIGITALLFAAIVALPAVCSAALINLTPTNGVNSNNSVLLSDLVSGEVTGVTVGDKDFTGFSYSRLGDMPLPQDVNVLGFKDPDGNWGISFHGVFKDNPGGPDSDALVRYMVAVNPTGLQQGFKISDAHLFLGGAGVGPDSVITVDESFLGLNNTMHAFMSSLGPGGTKLSDSTLFNPNVLKLNVVKDIFASAGPNSSLPARTTVIDQSFSQTKIPEPATLMMSLIGMVGVGTYLRKRDRK
jgi:PEP-CTERM motif-containing protein